MHLQKLSQNRTEGEKERCGGDIEIAPDKLGEIYDEEHEPTVKACPES